MRLPISILLCAAALALPTYAIGDGIEAGHNAPNCALNAVREGQRIDLQQFRGKVLYVDFWASWCGPCAQSFPFMNDLNHDLRGRGLQVVGINLDEEPGEAKDFLARRPAHFDVAVDGDKSCAHHFGVKAMPSSYLVDRNGVVRHVHLGFRPGEAAKLRTVVEQLLAEGPAAR